LVAAPLRRSVRARTSPTTDFYLLEELLEPDEIEIRDRVRDFCAREVTADMEAILTLEGTDSVQALIVGREITGLSAISGRRSAPRS
jgi:hypothetical protein